MSINKDIFLKKMLIDNNILSKGDIEDAYADAESQGKRFRDLLLERGLLSEEQLISLLSKLLGINIVDLKNNGVELTYELRKALITYIGDSTIKIFDKYDFIKKSEILIVECTFLTPEHLDQARKRSHIHLQDIIDRLDTFDSNYIILSHFSMRYSEDIIKKSVYDSINHELKEKILLFI